MASLPKNTIKHFTHPSHPLLDMYEDKEYICGGCKTIGDGKRYRCDPCDFDLHGHCATCPTTLSSFFMHPQHQLNLVIRKPQATCQNLRMCNVCGDLVEGLFYRCKICDFNVHPHCTQYPQNARSKTHPAHPLTLQPSSASCCLVCKSVCTSWRYRCGICRVDLHIECVLEPCDESSQLSDSPPYQSLSPPDSPPYQPLSPPDSPPYQPLSPPDSPPYQPLSPPDSPPYGMSLGFDPICDADEDDEYYDDGGLVHDLDDEFHDYRRMTSGFGPDGIFDQSESSIITPECSELSSVHVQQTQRVSITRTNESSPVRSDYEGSLTHEYGMPSGSSPNTTMDQDQRHPNLNQAKGAGGATNGGKKSKEEKMFALLGNLSLGSMDDTIQETKQVNKDGQINLWAVH